MPGVRALARREDLGVDDLSSECAVCHRLRSRGSYEPSLAIFICVSCEQAAAQLLEIQDGVFGDRVDIDDDETER